MDTDLSWPKKIEEKAKVQEANAQAHETAIESQLL